MSSTGFILMRQQMQQGAWCATLGKPDEDDKNGVKNKDIDRRIRSLLGDTRNWVLIGGPPCQAFSLVGRSRRQEKQLDEKKDKRVGLYKEYLRILAKHLPAVFVMENVKGLLSAQTNKVHVFNKILEDLRSPVQACIAEKLFKEENPELTNYRIYSLTTLPKGNRLDGSPIFEPEDFLIHAEVRSSSKRHRVLLGIREDLIQQGGYWKTGTGVIRSVIGGYFEKWYYKIA
ncbi:MAG: DNA cytosine methyltransferase [Odoribacter splanchnicus]